MEKNRHRLRKYIFNILDIYTVCVYIYRYNKTFIQKRKICTNINENTTEFKN